MLIQTAPLSSLSSSWAKTKLEIQLTPVPWSTLISLYLTDINVNRPCDFRSSKPRVSSYYSQTAMTESFFRKMKWIFSVFRLVGHHSGTQVPSITCLASFSRSGSVTLMLAERRPTHCPRLHDLRQGISDATEASEHTHMALMSCAQEHIRRRFPWNPYLSWTSSATCRLLLTPAASCTGTSDLLSFTRDGVPPGLSSRVPAWTPWQQPGGKVYIVKVAGVMVVWVHTALLKNRETWNSTVSLT